MSNICRLCLQSYSEKYYSIDIDGYREKMQSVIPEIDIEMVEEPSICEKCSDILLSAYSFRSNCLQIDEELKTYAKNDGTQIKLQDFLRQRNKTSFRLEEDVSETQENNSKVFKQEINLEEETLEIKISETLSTKNDEKKATNKKVTEKSTARKKQRILVNKCEICNKIFLRKSTLDRHIKEHKNYNCTVCNLKMPCKSSLEEHMRTHTGERPFQCMHCGKAFAQSGVLTRHVRSIHMSERPYVCEVCGMAFPVRSAYTGHKRRRHDPVEKKFVCSHCGKAYLVKSRLQEHMRWHTGERNYLCQVCSKSFVDNASLKKHLRIHNGEKPYECPICQKTFTQNYNKKVHVRSCSQRNAPSAEAK